MLAKQIKMKGKISVVYVEISLTVHHLCFLFTICDGKRTLLQRFSLACLKNRSRNEEAINSERNRIYSRKVFLLPNYRLEY